MSIIKAVISGCLFLCKTKARKTTYRSMVILTTENITEQTMHIIPVSVDFNKVMVTDEQTNVSVEITDYTITANSYYFDFRAIFNLKENRFYTIEMTKDGAQVFRDKIYCTNQAIETYTVNKDQYKSNQTTNEFIII
jgi:hypothetical protein